MTHQHLDSTTLAWAVVKAVRDAVDRSPEASTLTRDTLFADAIEKLAAGLDPAMLRRMLNIADRVNPRPHAVEKRRSQAGDF